MESKKLRQLVENWEQTTCAVLKLLKIHYTDFQALLMESYEVLEYYCKSELVPKDISRLFLEMESFLYFAFLMENKEVGGDFYHYRRIHLIVAALKDGFFNSNYEYTFPKLKLSDDKSELVFDFENDNLENIAI